MQISPDPGRCMALLVKLPGARRAIEVGVFTGYSALSAALALPDDGRLLACDISDDDTRVGRPYWSQAACRNRSACASRQRSRRSTRNPRPAQDADTAALQQLNTRLRDDLRVDMSLLTIGDGQTLARKR